MAVLAAPLPAALLTRFVKVIYLLNYQGAIQVLRNTVGGVGVGFPGKKRYEGVQFNVITITRGWVGVKFTVKKRHVTLEWLLNVEQKKC